MQQIKIEVTKSENFTPASLMHRYAKQNPAANIAHDHWGSVLLILAGKAYRYHHWSITAEQGKAIVTLYLEATTSRR